MSTTIQRQHSPLTLPANLLGRDFFVGDLHGQYDMLIQALRDIAFDPDSDRVFCVGDLVDRGPASMECLELLDAPWFWSVLGNHEDFLIDAVAGNDQAAANLFANGGRWAAFADQDRLEQLVADYVATLPLAIRVEQHDGRAIGVIHAAVTSGVWGRFDQNADIWNRRIIRGLNDVAESEAWVTGIDAVVVGHNVVSAPSVVGNTIMIDTGAARGERITMLTSGQILDMCSGPAPVQAESVHPS